MKPERLSARIRASVWNLQCKVFRRVLALVTLGCLFWSTSVAQSPLFVNWLYSPVPVQRSVAYSPSGSLIAVGGRGGIQIFEASSGALIRCLPTAATCSEVQPPAHAGVNSVSFSPDGQLLAVGGQQVENVSGVVTETGVAEIWRVSTGTLVASLGTLAQNAVLAVGFSPDGSLLGVGGQGAGGGVLELWSVPTTTLVDSLPSASAVGGTVNSLAFSPDGLNLADGGSDDAGGLLEVWNIASGALSASLPTSATTLVNSVAFSADATMLVDGGLSTDAATGATSGVLEAWSVSSGTLIQSLPTIAAGGVGAVALSMNSQSLISGGASTGGLGVLEEWNVSAGALIRTFATSNFMVNSIAYSPDGTLLVDGGGSSSGDGVVELWNVANGASAGSLNTFLGQAIATSAFSPDGTLLVFGGGTNAGSLGGSGVLEVWSASNGLRIGSLKTSATFVYAAAFSPNGKSLAVGGLAQSRKGTYTGVLEIWDVASWTRSQTLSTAANRGVYSVAFTPDGNSVVDGGLGANSGNDLGVLETWDVLGGTLIGSFPTAASLGVLSVAISPDGKTLADGGTGANGGVAETWNLSTGLQIQALKTAASGGVNTVSFGLDGSVLVLGGAGAAAAVVEVWNPTTGTKLASPSLASGAAHVYSACFSPDGTVLFAGASGELQAFDASSYEPLGSYGDPNQTSNTDAIDTISFISGGSVFAYGTGNGSLTVAANPFYNPIAVSSVSVSPSTVLGGTGAMGTVTLSQPAPASGDGVVLASGSAAVGIPAFIRVAAGQTQASFPITTQPVTTNASVVITVTSGGASATAQLNVSDLSISSLKATPVSVQGGSSATVTLMLAAPAPTGGITIALSSNSAFATPPATVSVAGGATSATFSVSTLPVDSVMTATIRAGTGAASKSTTLTITPPSLVALSLSPATVVGGAGASGTVTLSGATGPSGMTIALGAGATCTIPNSLNVPAGQSSATFSIATSGVTSAESAVIEATEGGITKKAKLTIDPAAISALTISPSSIVGGNSTTGTVNLSGNAGPNGFVVNLFSSSSAVKIQKSQAFEPGQSSASFILITIGVSSQSIVTITASNGAVSKKAVLALNPPGFASFALNPSAVHGGAISTATVVLNGAAGPGGQPVKLMSSTSVVKVPTSVIVPAGKTTATFLVRTVAVGAQQTATVTAKIGATTETAALTVNPPSVSLLKLNPATVPGGKGSTGTVTLSSAAPAGGLVVTLASGLATVTVPSAVMIPAGRNSATFTVKTKAVSAKTTATISAMFGSSTASASLTVL